MEPEVLIRQEGALGRITLDRPAALNALTLEMVRQIAAALRDWDGVASVRSVVIEGAGPRAFCAGGDVTALHAAALARDYAFPARFWADEYALDLQIARYAKPVIALIHGYCMGGGVGLACHARHRIVAASARIAMPECGIGLVPDVGGTRLLARAPAGIGPWMALTGAQLEPGPAIAAGFGDGFIDAPHWDRLRADLAAGEEAALVLARLEEVAPPAQRPLPDAALRAAFQHPDLQGIRDALDGIDGEAATAAAAAMDRASPLAMATALLMQARLTPSGGLADALRLEYRAVQRALKQGDFVEGVRAKVIDRDNAPRWKHGGIDRVSRIEAAAQLAALDGGDLDLDDRVPEEGKAI